jgi:hypothetical protein
MKNRALTERDESGGRSTGRAAIYTFYLCSGDGCSSTFEAFELGGDEFAPQRALRLLAEHPSCAYVAVWSEDRQVLSRYRCA